MCSPLFFLGDYGIIENLDSEILDCAKKAKDLIDAPKVDGKETTVVLDQILAGVFVHEAFGHLSEADNVYENERFIQELFSMNINVSGIIINQLIIINC